MSNMEQIEYWNGEAGERWAQDDDIMARLLQPITEALLEHAAPVGCRKALDVGCGGGSQSLLLAQQLGGRRAGAWRRHIRTDAGRGAGQGRRTRQRPGEP